jgi:lipopolysaccharide export system permease protein
MNALDTYLFRQALTPLLAILAGLAGIAILTQGLSRLDIIVDQGQSALAFAWVTLLTVPQLVSLIMPLGVFFAVIYAVNRLHSENEIAVAFAAGISPWQIMSPILKLATVAALAHLAVNVVIQPASYREMRETTYSMKNDLAASLVREGEFTHAADGLTVYARTTGAGGSMRDLFINDGRNGARPTTYTARTGRMVESAGRPAIQMREGQIQRPNADGSIGVLNFDQYTLELSAFEGPEDQYLLKPSDRFLAELFFPDKTSFYDVRNAEKFLSEAHHRLSSPLLNPALALIALVGLLGGEFSRRGYGARIAIASGVAILVRFVALGIQAGAEDDSALNPVQHMFPLLVIAVGLFMLRGRASFARRRAQKAIAARQAGAHA